MPKRSYCARKKTSLMLKILARFAQTQKPALWNPPPQVYYKLQQRLCQREDLIGVRGQLGNQLHALTVGSVVVESVKGRLLQLIQTIPGIGLLTACWLVVLSLNFTACKNGASLAHYAGLAPVERRSGTSVRGYPQVGGGGHSHLRRLLYMAALSASRFNPPFYTIFRLLAYFRPILKSVE